MLAPVLIVAALAAAVASAQYPTEWRIPDGESGGPAAMETWIALTNVSAAEGGARITVQFGDGTAADKFYAVGPLARIEVLVGRDFPASTGRRFGVLIESVGDPPAELHVDWATYSTLTADVHHSPDGRLQTSAGDGGASIETAAAATSTGGAAFNVRLATDASPDLTDLQGLVHSTTSRWPENRDKVWALYYWTRVLKKQTPPVVLHGFEVTDPIRNFLDYGFTMCSTIAGIHQSLFRTLGLRHQYWDICNHSVSAVEFDGKFRMIDSSMSNLVTADDGTLATVEEAAADSARLVRERSLYGSSPNGFLTGSDNLRPLVDSYSPANGSLIPGFYRNFCSNGLKLRDFYYNWDAGHRYVLNLREDEAYTRYYRRLGDTPEYWVGSERIASPDPAHTVDLDAGARFGLSGNGTWTFTPKLTADGWARAAYRSANVAALPGGGLKPLVAGQTADVVYKVQAGNAIASQTVRAQFARSIAGATASIAVSLNHGLTWIDAGSLGAEIGSAVPLTVVLRTQVNGAYETLVRIRMSDGGSSDAVVLTAVTIDTITQVNTRGLPRLNVGRNEIVVGLGDQTETMVLWPDLRGDLWKRDAYDASNIASQGVSVPRKFTAVAYPAVLSQDAYLTYRLDAPADITRVVYGGRLHNYRAGSYIDFLHSFDNGATWTRSYRHSDVSAPWDVIHHETVTAIPPGVRTVLFKFLIHNTDPTAGRASGLYSVRMEANYRPAQATRAPIDVTLRWKEVRPDRTLVDRSHRQRVAAFPFKYVVNVGGADHPEMESIRTSVADDSDSTPFGYGDGINPGGQKYIYSKRTDGTNVAKGRPYSFSRAPSGFQYSAGASNTTILTDGVVGAPGTGGFSYYWGQCWSSGADFDLQVDLGAVRPVSAFRAHLFGYPFWDALQGRVQDRIEIFTSADGVTFSSQGLLQTSLWKKDIPINYMLLDDEKATAWNFERTIAAPVSTRYVRYRITPKRILCASELQVFDRVSYEPFDIRIALPSATDPGPDPEPNSPPSVSMTTPVDGASFSAPASIGVAAQASDADGTISRVEFLAGSTVIATTTASPFAITWRDVPAGTYVLSARAYDNAGASTSSSPVNVTVRPASEPPPDGTIDEIVLHAAASATIAGGWTVTPDATAASGARLQNPDAGAPKVTTPVAAPTQSFDLTFTADRGRPYRLWLRGRALNDSYGNDSVFVQFEGSVDASGAPMWRIGSTSATAIVLEECNGCGVRAWGWADNGYGLNTLGPVVYFATSGPQRLRIQVREDGLAIDQVVLSAVKYMSSAPGATKNDATILAPTTGGTPPPAAGEVVLYAAQDAQTVGGWSVVPDSTAAGGARLQNADIGQAKQTTPLANPAQAFDVTFTAAAETPYRLWLRGKALANSYNNDSVFVQFDGSVDSAGAPMWRIGTTSATAVVLEDCNGCGLQEWGWADNGYGANVLGPLVYFATSGPQRVRIQVREDGLGIDQIVLSPERYLNSSPGATKNDVTIIVPSP